LLDWIVTSLRWLTLFALAISLGVEEGLPANIVLCLLAAALWNLFLTVLAALNRRLSAHRYLGVAGDMLVAYLLFFLSGGLQGSLGWAGMLPIISAALYFQVEGVVFVTLVNLLAQGLLALASNELLPVLVFLGTLLPLYLVTGGLLGYLVRRMLEVWNGQRLSQVSSRRETGKAESERRRAIYDLISTLSASLNYQRVLDTALDMSARGLAGPNGSEDRLVSTVLLYTAAETGGTELRVGSARRFTSADLRIALPGTSGLIGRAIDEGEPRSARSLVKDPELSRVIALRTCQSAYCLPLRSGLDTYGVLLFAHPEEEFFTPDRREILDIIGNQATIAIQNARLYRDLEQEKERMMEIQEDARKKLARDLHDGPTQSVAALAMRVNFARRLMDRDPKAAADELYKVEELARRTTKEIRHMLFTLRPLVLESQGLIAALESMAEKMDETYNQKVIIDADPDLVSQLEPGKQGVIFYIAEEAVSNARKHARAARIWVRLKTAGEELALLEVQDDGGGFNLASVDANYENRGSLGMVNMRERAELLNGVLQVESADGRGTCIRVLIPLSEQAADRVRRGL
jgi:signal transduction histidine kinase